MNRKIVIVGGVAGGATAAARLRRIDEHSHIVMFERGAYISYANCGLPYYIGGTIKERSKLLVQTVEGMTARFGLDIRTLTEVVRINREQKTVTVRHLPSGDEYEESYDTLILSPGSKPIVPPIPGLAESTYFTLRNIPDTDKIYTFLEDQQPQNATIIGGGFIGLELAENLVDRGLNVTLVEKSPQVMAPIDREMAALVHTELKQKGITLYLNDGVKAFEEQGKQMILESGTSISTDLVVLSIGVTPENTLATLAGLETNERGGIIVDDHLKTNDPSIYAVGDAVQVKDYQFGQPTMIPLAWPANRQGRLVADHIYGKDVRYNGTLGTSIAKIFDLTVAATGKNEKQLKAMGLPYEAIHIHPGSHAGYYPNATPLSMKLLFHPVEGTIYGAQIIGKEGADKRIDVLATAIKGGLTVMDLPDLELAYAPPYSSAKDPVNLLGYVASNIVEGEVEVVHWDEMDGIAHAAGMILDVRTSKEFSNGAIRNAVNIPLDDLRDRLEELPKEEPITVYCQAGLRGYVATKLLEQHGFRVKNLEGGYKTYSIAMNDLKELQAQQA
ncbi:pyridine nucleotide-disulfide oxidoreductase [Pontibacillus chungwhensis BH030062]|uniref:Pyridine nucleotide-disulfide oxidoreductase n=1 Tax=Pontibacillus chungwhensis BH030062 TaxID=1385513 RepID=A0A0A2UR15_9BACI|nr:CoA-disulfide reductase [Pontibacillus chungwhensis]KGP90747.1 pyridine nucleotide-disulfide oxidoreductase [Pontibacillus chungwhensis BH030062]